MRYATIKGGLLTLVTGPLTLADLQREVGGLIEPIFTVGSVERAGYRVTGYANEEGGALGLAPNVITPVGPVYGPMVLCGIDREGETCELTAREFAQVHVVHSDGNGFFMALDLTTGDVFRVPVLSVEAP